MRKEKGISRAEATQMQSILLNQLHEDLKKTVKHMSLKGALSFALRFTIDPDYLEEIYMVWKDGLMDVESKPGWDLYIKKEPAPERLARNRQTGRVLGFVEQRIKELKLTNVKAKPFWYPDFEVHMKEGDKSLCLATVQPDFTVEWAPEAVQKLSMEETALSEGLRVYRNQ
eukprot:TRINITY_DN30652_c0_g1_i1.p1 TRINITY_DN30652_c0_g1~~TRINITY_DN30652_c0_g1_i1.p1  ORF type:complete len:171 (-),score=45.33 TRINITY_DN30652_c0_g1_i1:129-641(-)